MSDEIPVGSPPVPPGRHAAPGGWYPDPASEAQERYWDGWQWTRNVRPGGAGAGAAPGVGHGQQQPGQYSQYPQDSQPYAPQSQGNHLAYPTNPYSPPVPRTTDGVPLAGWGWRLLAYLIDAALLGIVGAVIDQITGLAAATDLAFNSYQAYLTETMTTNTQLDLGHAIGLLMTPALFISQGIAMVLFIAYHALMLRSRSATLGKLAVGLRVVPVNQGMNRESLDWFTCLIRPVVTQLMNLVPLLSLIDYLFPLWDKQRQTLHDKVAKTQVVKIR